MITYIEKEKRLKSLPKPMSWLLAMSLPVLGLS